MTKIDNYEITSEEINGNGLVIHFEVNGTPCAFTVDIQTMTDKIIKDLLNGEVEENVVAEYGIVRNNNMNEAQQLAVAALSYMVEYDVRGYFENVDEENPVDPKVEAEAADIVYAALAASIEALKAKE